MSGLGLAQTRAEWRRLVAAAIAVLLGAMFVSATILGGASFERASLAIRDPKFGQADFIVTPHFQVITDAQLAELPSARSTCINHTAAASLHAGKRSIDLKLSSTCPAPEFQRSTPIEGRLPLNRGEIALDALTAKRLDLGPGGTVVPRMIDQSTGTALHLETGVKLTVVGIVQIPHGSPPAQVTHDTMQQLLTYLTDTSLTTTSLLITTDSKASLEREIRAASWVSTFTGREATRQAQFQAYLGSSNPAGPLTWTFVTVALVVATFVVATTFQMLVAQRSRRIGLLRSVGATRQQIRNLVFKEAAAVGLVGGLGGVALGHALVAGTLGLYRTAAPASVANISFVAHPLAIAAPLVVSLAVTLVAAYLPARTAMQTAPLAVLRQTAAPRTKRSPTLSAVGVVLLLTGVSVMWVAITTRTQLTTAGSYTHDPLTVLAIVGGAMTALSFLLLSPLVFPPITATLGKLVQLVSPRSLRPSVAVARSNLERNKARTVATSNAVLVGAALVAMLSTGVASARTSMEVVAEGLLPADIVVEPASPHDNLLDEALLRNVSKLPGVVAVAPMIQAHGHLKVGELTAPVTVLIADPDKLARASHSSETIELIKKGSALVPPSTGFRTDQQAVLSLNPQYRLPLSSRPSQVSSGQSAELPLEVPVQIRVTTTPGWNTIIHQKDIEKFGFGNHEFNQLWIRTAPGQINAVRQAVALLLPFDTEGRTERFSVSAPGEAREATLLAISTAVTAGATLLGVAVLIALVGVVNSLSLSVFERRREISLLRALGFTRRQLRLSLAAEGLIMTLSATLLGIVVGALLGLAGSALLFSGSSGAASVIPWAALGLLALAACLAGPLASILPARAALRRTALEGLSAS